MNKPGYSSTEFWLSLFAMLVGAVMASGVLDQTATGIDNQIVGIIATILGALGYTVSRTFVKGAAAKADAIKVAAGSPPADPT